MGPRDSFCKDSRSSEKINDFLNGEREFLFYVKIIKRYEKQE